MSLRIIEKLKYKSSLAESHSFFLSPTFQSIRTRGFVRVQSREAGDNKSQKGRAALAQ